MFKGQCMTSGMQRVNLSGKSWISFSVTHSARGPIMRTGLNTGSSENKFNSHIHSQRHILKLTTHSTALLEKIMTVTAFKNNPINNARVRKGFRQNSFCFRKYKKSKILHLQSSLSTRWYEQRATSSFRVPESLYHPRLILEKLASSFESRDELRWCFLRRKKLRLADVEPRLASASKSPKLRRKSNSSSTLWEKHHPHYYAVCSSSNKNNNRQQCYDLDGCCDMRLKLHMVLPSIKP